MLHPKTKFSYDIVHHKIFKHSVNSCTERSSLRGGQRIYKTIYVSYLLLGVWLKNKNFLFLRILWIGWVLLIFPRLTYKTAFS